MSKASYTLYIIIVTFILTGCQGESRYHSRLRALDSVLVQSPDSVYKVLVAEEKEAQQQSRSDRMYYELLRADAQNKAYIDFTTDSLMLQVADYYDHHCTANQQMRAHYLLGCTYRDLGDTPRALESYMTASDKADTLSSNCDYHRLMVIHSQMAEIYSAQSLYNQEIKEDEVAEGIAWEIKDTLSAMYFREMQAKIQFYKGNYEKTLELSKDTYRKYLDLGMETKACLSCSDMINVYLKLKDYKNAKKAIDIYGKGLLSNNHAELIKSGDKAYWTFLGHYYLGIHENDSAEIYYRQALSSKHKEGNATIYYGLNSISIIRSQLDSISKYTSLYADSKEEEFDVEYKKQCIQVQQIHNYMVERSIAEKEKAKSERLNYIIVLLVTILILGLILYTHVRYRVKKKHELEIEEMKFLHQKSINKLHLLEEELHTSKLNSAEVESERANMIQEIQTLKRRIAGYENILTSQEARSKGIELKDSYIVQHMKESLFHINLEITDDDWNTLVSTVETIHPNFHMIMNRYSSLNDREYKICLLVKCGFSPKAIDVLLDLPHGTSSTMRQRLHKKVFNEEGKACDFDKKVARIL